MFVTVLSDKPELRESFCKSMGKEISRDEFALYSMDAPDRKIYLIDPVHYPEKIQPLLHSLSMSDYVVLIVDTLTPKVGELLVALNSIKAERGIIVSSLQLPVNGTVLAKYDKVAYVASVKEKILAASASSSGENAFGLVYKTENIPSRGHVAFGVLRGGKVKKADKMFLLPEAKDLEVRSVHSGGSEPEELSAISHFEIAYKGDLIQHGILAPLRHGFEVQNIVNGKFTKSPFFKDEIKGKIYAYLNMQYVEGHVTENDLTLSAPLAFEKGDSMLIIDASNQKLRVAGVFQSKW
ncbi:hypothetical protein HY990_06935 [Candidatus Micrarchaeota archaeon]|nr:hypothetical protein [Candidatus Micrarchaeota archaeon]